MVSRVLIAVAIWLALVAFLFGLFSFVQLSIDPRAWTRDARAFLAFLTVGAAGCCLVGFIEYSRGRG